MDFWRIVRGQSQVHLIPFYPTFTNDPNSLQHISILQKCSSCSLETYKYRGESECSYELSMVRGESKISQFEPKVTRNPWIPWIFWMIEVLLHSEWRAWWLGLFLYHNSFLVLQSEFYEARDHLCKVLNPGLNSTRHLKIGHYYFYFSQNLPLPQDLGHSQYLTKKVSIYMKNQDDYPPNNLEYREQWACKD